MTITPSKTSGSWSGGRFGKRSGDRAGIKRFGEATVPLDEAVCTAIVDISGRAYLGYNVPISQERVGNFQTELVHDFMKALTDEVGMNLHLNLVSGRNPHHIIEATFKALARAMDHATAREPRLSGVALDQGHAQRLDRLFEKFTVIPSIDLKGGQVVRLLHGDMTRATVYGGDPGDVARRFEAEGAELIHIVDLDGAIAGAPRNLEAVAQIRAAVKCAIDVSGGLRTIEAVRAMFAGGADRVSIGSAAFLNPALVRQRLRRVPRPGLRLDRHSRRAARRQRMGRDQPTHAWPKPRIGSARQASPPQS